MSDSQWVINVDGTTFAQEVIERSRKTPVLLDFWASWCGPCRTLGPVLEKLAQEMSGRFVLAKIDSDQNQDLARQYGVRGIPAVKLFVDGVVVSEFTGALPESQVRRFLEKELPSPLDKQAQQVADVEERDLSAALTAYQSILDEDPHHVASLLGMTRVLLAMERMAEAGETFARLKPYEQQSVAAKVLGAKLTFATQAGDPLELAAKVKAEPTDLAARLAYGEVLVAQEQYEEGLQQLLEVVRRDRNFAEDGGRKAVLRVFDLLGAGHPLIAIYRPQLSALLFS